MEQIARKICVYQIKAVPLHTVFIFEFGFMVIWTPYAVIALGVFFVGNCPYFAIYVLNGKNSPIFAKK